MDRPLLLLGDVDATLEDLATHDSFVPTVPAGDDPRPRAVVVAVDLRGVATRSAARAKLRAAGDLSAHAAQRSPDLRHVIIGATLDPGMVRHFDRLASAVATRFHSQLERTAGRDIEFTLLDVTTCTDHAKLCERLRERALDPAGVHGVVILEWDDIMSMPIARAAREQYL